MQELPMLEQKPVAREARRFKGSRYNHFVKQEDGSRYVYNSVTNAMSVMDEEAWIRYQAFRKGDYPNPDVELDQHMIEGGYVVPEGLDEIVRATAHHFEVEASDLRSKGRRHELVVPRQVAMYLIREFTPHSYPEIGQFFTGRDHSTVMYAVQKVTEQMAKDRELEERILAIKADLL